MCDWVVDHLGTEVPVHFTAFHPDFRMQDRPATPRETLVAAYDIARGQGLKYVYVGNVHDPARQTTHCPGCDEVVIGRNWYRLGHYTLAGSHCAHCGYRIAGHFEAVPGDWGRRRLPVHLS